MHKWRGRSQQVGKCGRRLPAAAATWRWSLPLRKPGGNDANRHGRLAAPNDENRLRRRLRLKGSGAGGFGQRSILDHYSGRNANFVRVTATSKGYQGQGPWLIGSGGADRPEMPTATRSATV